MELQHLSYKDDFFWEGVRYTQVIRPKGMKNYSITCRPTRDPSGVWVEMPAEREVKPVIKLTYKKYGVNSGKTR